MFVWKSGELRHNYELGEKKTRRHEWRSRDEIQREILINLASDLEDTNDEDEMSVVFLADSK